MKQPVSRKEEMLQFQFWDFLFHFLITREAHKKSLLSLLLSCFSSPLPDVLKSVTLYIKNDLSLVDYEYKK